MDHWNKKEIAQPPNFTLEFVAEEWHENNIEKCVVSLTSGLSRLDASLCDEVLLQYFNTEAKVLKVLLGKNQKHRQEKFYGLLKKIFRCIERFQGLKLVDFVAKLRKMMPVIIEQFRSIRLPSRQMFEYLLARVYGAFQIFLTLETCCREVVPYLVKKINIGHSYWNAITLLAVVARLRTLAIDFAGQLASVYDDIVPWLQHLKGGATLNLMAENPFYLMKKLEMHCKVAKHNKYSEIMKNASSVINESNILDIFNDNVENSADLISSNSLCENKDKLDIKPQNNAKTTYTSKKKKKLRTIKNKSSSGTKNGTIGRLTDGDTFNNALNKQDILTEKQQLLKLLDIFDDDASEEASSHVLNKFQCSRDNQKESGIAADILSEDIGECAESNRFRSKKQSSKRKKSFDNVKEGDCKISKKKKKKISRRNVTDESNKISKKKKISRRNVTVESNKISKKKKICRRNVTEESNKISKKKKICRRNVTNESNDAQHNKTFRR